MKVRSKIISGLGNIFLIGLIIGLYGLYSIKTISELSEKLTYQQNVESEIIKVVQAHLIWRQELTLSAYTGVPFSGSQDPTTCALGKWEKSDGARSTKNPEILALLEQVHEPHDFMHKNAHEILTNIELGDMEEAQRIFNEVIYPVSSQTITILENICAKYDEDNNVLIKELSDLENRSLIIIIVLVIFGVISSLIIGIIITGSIMKPIKSMAKSAELVASGRFDEIFQYNIDDEIGTLSRNFTQLTDIVRSIIKEFQDMSKKHEEGEIDYFIEAEKFNGQFRDVVQSVNIMVNEYNGYNDSILQIIEKYSQGDFSVKLKKLPGKKARANKVLDGVADNLFAVEDSILLLVKSAIDGELEKRVDSTKFNGGWARIINGLNDVLDAVSVPLNEISRVMVEMSNGNLQASFQGKYSGDYKKVENAVNTTSKVISSYINEINDSLEKMSDGDLRIRITREYIGQFSTIKESINSIAKSLNNTVSEISAASDQVLSGAKHISETSMSLAEGASEQASSIEELTARADQINQETKVNTENATFANELSSKSMKNALNGQEDMKNMLVAINGIQESSQSISKIIKVIEDIAFQTNLLALNAAVEAARAGVHGKGFAVVADEVRNLASKSNSAAKETTVLINDSIIKVNEGTKSANDTSNALNTIIEDTRSVSEMISKIYSSSKDQEEDISLINSGLEQVSAVVQNNSSTSEESASTAQELNSQAEMLKQMVAFFKI